MRIHTFEPPALRFGSGFWTCDRGTHACGRYESDVERDEIITGFRHRGGLDGAPQPCCLGQRPALEMDRALKAVEGVGA